MPELPKSIKLPSQLLSESRGALKAVFKHSQALLTIQSIIREVIPGEIQVAAHHQGMLHLITPSAALATRIKYSQRALIAALRQRKNPFVVKNIKVSVRPQFHEKLARTRTATPPSRESARHIAAAAQYIEDEPLRKALIKLSQAASSDD